MVQNELSKSDIATKRLVDIMLELDKVQEDLIDNDGELTPELEKMLSIAESELQDKLDSYSQTIAILEDLQEYYKKETKRLTKRINSISKRVEWLKSSMINAILLYGNGGVYLSKNHTYRVRYSKAVEVDPMEFERVKTELLDRWSEHRDLMDSKDELIEAPLKFTFTLDTYGDDVAKDDVYSRLAELNDLLYDHSLGINLNVTPVKSLINKNDVEPKVPSYMKIVNNESLSIK